MSLTDLNPSIRSYWLGNKNPSGNLRAFIKALQTIQKAQEQGFKGVMINLSTILDEIGEAEDELNYQACVVRTMLYAAGFKEDEVVKSSWNMVLHLLWEEDSDLPTKYNEEVVKI